MAGTEQGAREDSARRGPGALIAAVILIAVGVIFFLQNRGVAIPTNLWSLVLLVPAAFALSGVWQRYRANGGRFGPGMASPLITAVILIGLTVVFLLDIDVPWGVFLPLLLVAVGFAILLQSLPRR